MLSKRTARFFDIAIDEAMKSNIRQQHGAVIVRGGSVIATGFNKIRNSPSIVPAGQFPPVGVSVHAEMDALKKVKNPIGASIYVARVGRDGHIKLSKPCYNCWQQLIKAGIKGIYYT